MSVETLCEDLLLLVIDAYGGRLGNAYALGYGLMGAELIRLAAAGRIDISGEQIVVTDLAPIGDPELDAALTRIIESPSPPAPAAWVARPRARIYGGYLERLESAAVVRSQKSFIGTRMRITEPSRLADARGRLDAIAESAGELDLSRAAYGGIAHAIGLDRRLYRGRAGRAKRHRLREVAEGRSTVGFAAAGESVAETRGAGQGAARAAVGAVAEVYAATDAVVRATTQAVADVTHSTAAGHGGGGHHGGHGH